MLGFRKYSYRFALSQVKNIHEDIIEDVSDLVAFIMGENIDLQRKGQKGSVVITKYRRGKHGEEVIVAQKLELPMSGDVEDFEKLLSKFHSKKPLSFEPIPSEESVLPFQTQENTQEERQEEKAEEVGYAPAPELHFEEENTPLSCPGVEESVAGETLIVSEKETETAASFKALLDEKEEIIETQKKELLELRTLVSEGTTQEGQETIEKTEQVSEVFPRLLPKDRPSHIKNQLQETLHLEMRDPNGVAFEAIELLNQAKRGMQPRDVIEYQVAVEIEATKQRELKEAEEQAEETKKNEIAQAQKQFEEKQKEITTHSNLELRKTKAMIEQKFKEQAFEEVNARMQKQKEYIESFTADLSQKMMQYIENGSDVLEKES